MAKVDTFLCDICRVQKANSSSLGWWRAFAIMESLIVCRWDQSPETELGLDVGEGDVTAHFCSREHLFEWLKISTEDAAPEQPAGQENA